MENLSNFTIEIIFLVITLAITLGAQWYVNHCYNITKKISNNRNITGAETARKILNKNGLTNVKVEETVGILSDHYDPRSKVVKLSPEIYEGTSIASVSVAAHECGHAIQDKNNYFFLRLRSTIIPLVNFASYAGYIVIMIGAIMQALNIIWLGIILVACILLFQLITLPVEFNASSRALKQIKEEGILGTNELVESRKMLTAAALTYVASVAAAILEILRLVLIYTHNDRD